MKIRIFLFFFLVVFALQIHAQGNYYFISFKQKDTANFSSLNPESFITRKCLYRRMKFHIPSITINDIPVSEKNIQAVLPFVNNYLYSLKWFNGIVVKANARLIDSLKNNKNIKEIILIGYDKGKEKSENINLADRINMLEQRFDKNETTDSFLYFGKATDQIFITNTQKLHQQNLNGKGIDIAVFDAGYNNLNKLSFFNQSNIKNSFNLVNADENIYTNNDEHGLNVVSCMAANVPYKYVGAAPEANYHLFNTENNLSEYPIEEYYWAKAAEIADSLGVDIITSSLGYTEFDDKVFGHKKKEFSGNKTIIAQAANLAVNNGILVVVSAGNEGNKIWEYICTPADADKVISVGACNADKKAAAFTSIGFAKRHKVKPEIATIGESVELVNEHGKIIKGNGTSYSAPLIAGATACLLQGNRMKTPFEIKHAMTLSANQYYHANEFLGYGIPDMKLAHQLLAYYTNDTLIQTDQLADSNFHICLNSILNQKLEITLQTIEEKIVFKQKEKVEIGMNRFALKKSNKLKRGLYILKIRTANSVLIQKVEKL
jgi:serine protease AprX